MISTQPPAFLPAHLGALYQWSAHGELVLEQNDGGRRLFWSYGKLVFLQSDVAGEQFGNYLLRQGVLDLAALKELLSDARDERLGDKVVQWGLLSSEQRNQHLADLYDLILLNALEHPVVRYEWKDGATAANVAGGVPIALDHRKLVWQALTNLSNADSIPSWISAQKGWKWQAPAGLLSTLSDLPIDPQQAYALSFLGGEPLGFDTLLGASSLEPVPASRLVLALWAIGGLTLAEGEVPTLIPRKPDPVPVEPTSKPGAEVQRATTGKVPSLKPESVEPLMPVPNADSSPAPQAGTPGLPPVEDMHIEIVEEEEPGVGRGPIAFVPDSGAIKIEMESPKPLQTPTEPFRPISSGARNLSGQAPGAAGEEGVPDADEGDLLARARKLLRVAKNLQLQDRTGEAIQILEQAVRLDPDSDDAYGAWLLLGKLRTTNPAWSTRAVEALQSASRLHPRAAEPWAIMGEIYHRKGFRANAKGCFKKAIELDPSVPIPQDFSMEDKVADVEEKPGNGMFGKLKGLMKR